jgi:antitoxin component YwqK of YwqJK toxin-antitoxin module
MNNINTSHWRTSLQFSRFPVLFTSFAVLISFFSAVLYPSSLFAQIRKVEDLRKYRNQRMADFENEFKKEIPKDAYKTIVDPKTGEARTTIDKTNPGYQKALEKFEQRRRIMDGVVDVTDSGRRRTFNAMEKALIDSNVIQNTGSPTNSVQSDYDWTFKTEADAKRLFDELKAKGYSPEWDKSGRYFDVPGADIKGWVPHDQAEVGTEQYFKDVKTSANNVEIGMTQGELHKLTNDPKYLKSTEGAILGNVRKKVMANQLADPNDAIYTEYKTTKKILKDGGCYDAKDPSKMSNKELYDTLKAFEDRKTQAEAFDDFGTPTDEQKAKRQKMAEAADSEIIRVYAESAKRGAQIEKRRMDTADTLTQQGETLLKSSDPALRKRGNDLLNRADKLRSGVNKTAVSNSMTLQVISQHNPKLATKLAVERAKARVENGLSVTSGNKPRVDVVTDAVNSMKTRNIVADHLNGDTIIDYDSDGTKDLDGTKKIAGSDGIVKKSFLDRPVVKYLNKDLGKYEKMTDFTGMVGGACDEIQQELTAAAKEGREVSYLNITKNVAGGTGTNLAIGAVSKKVPVVGQIWEIATMPKNIAVTLNSNQQKRLDEYYEKYGEGHEFEAKMYATLDTMVDMSPIRGGMTAIDKVAKEEYDLVASGEADASYLRYYGKVAGESVLEIAKVNAIMKCGVDSYYGVDAAETKATIANQRYRDGIDANVQQHVGKMTAIRNEMNRLETTYGDDNPKANERIEMLKTMYNDEKDSVKAFAKRAHETLKGWDTQTRTIKDRLYVEDMLSESDKLQKKLTVIAGSGQTTSATVFEDLIEKREELRRKTEDLYKRTKDAQELYGKEHPHSLRLRDTLREQKSFLARIDAIDGVTPPDEWPVPDGLKKAVEKYKKWDYEVTVDDNGENLRRFDEDNFRQKVIDQCKEMEKDGKLPPGMSARDAFEEVITRRHENKLRDKAEGSGETDGGEDDAGDGDSDGTSGDGDSDGSSGDGDSDGTSGDGDSDGTSGDGEDDDSVDVADGESADDDDANIDESTDDETEDVDDNASLIAELSKLAGGWPEAGSKLADAVKCPDPVPVVASPGEVKISTFPDGSPRSKTCMVDGKKQGLQVYWNSPGVKREESSYLNGVTHGPGRRYDRSGKPQSESNNKNGQRHGPQLSFYLNGKVESEASYDEGKKHGPFRRWDDKGLLYREEFYKDDELLQSREWDRTTGRLKEEAFYSFARGSKGKRAKLKRTFNPFSGVLIRQDSIDENGKKQGTQIVRDLNTDLQRTSVYDKDNLRSYKAELNGQLTHEQFYKVVDGKSVPHGKQREWFSEGPYKGKLKLEFTWNEGVAHGSSKSFASSTKGLYKVFEGRWANGLRDGFWRFLKDYDDIKVYEMNFANGYPRGKQRFYKDNGQLDYEYGVSGKRTRSIRRFDAHEVLVFEEVGTFAESSSKPELKGNCTSANINRWDGIYFDLRYDKPWACLDVLPLITGVRHDYFTSGPEKGKLSHEANFRNGKLHGSKKEWYPSGKLKLEYNYSDGVLNGSKKEWYPNGQLKLEYNYSGGILDGRRVVYHENGKVSNEAVLSKGLIDGVYKKYTDTGINTLEVHYKAGLPHGKFRLNWYYKPEAVSSEGVNENGYHRGWWTEYSPDGTIKKKSHHKPGDKKLSPRKDDWFTAAIESGQECFYGPVYEVRNGKAHWSFGRPKSNEPGSVYGTDWATDAKEYFRVWRKADPSLPSDIPGVPGIPEPKEAPSVAVTPVGFDPSTYPRFPSGLSKDDAYGKLMEAWGAGNSRSLDAVVPLLQALENIEIYGHRRGAIATTHEKLVNIYVKNEKWGKALYHALEARKIWVEEGNANSVKNIDETIALCKRGGADL